MNDTDAVLELEARRCAAICAVDGDALKATLSDDYVHVHATSNIDNRAGFIEGVLANPRIVERGPITVRLYGEMAILIGEQTNRNGPNVMVGVLQEIAMKRDGQWVFVSAQMTRKN